MTPDEGYELDGDVVVTKKSDSSAVTVTDNKFTMPSGGVSVSATFKESQSAPTIVSDELTYASIGITGTTYTAWTGKKGAGNAVYAGKTAGGNNAIQLRSNGSDCGIVVTTSGGRAAKILVSWNSNSADGRTIDIYGKSTAYGSAADLYSNSKGTSLGSIVYGTSTELTVSGDYEFIGIRSNSGALYLDSITIQWEA